MNPVMREITISVVSHGQGRLVDQFLRTLQEHSNPAMPLIITENIHDPVSIEVPKGWHATRIVNSSPKGFAANHNAAFKSCNTPYFCVVNPDIQLAEDPFPGLVEHFADAAVAVVAPLVKNPAGRPEDSARRFPSAFTLLRKALLGDRADYPHTGPVIAVDWVAGMFMVFRSSDYASVGGFDERYFLYYEDVDICRRLARSGKKVIYDPRVTVIHDARRESRRNPRLARHHLASMRRYFFGH